MIIVMIMMMLMIMITHTHTCLTALYPGLPGYLDFTVARDSEWQWHLLGHMQVCTSLQTDKHTSTPSPLGQLSLASLRGRLIEYQLLLG